ncbi:MAG: hypothetical protein RL654_2916 [Pseudomonadota bacterium]|jgi:DNA-binding transcriptional LysR family regulator
MTQTLRNLTLKSLRIFEAAAATASYSRGAELMNMTQSAVSQQIRQLEEDLGVRLFDTHARPIRLTESGAEFLRHARVILAQVSVAEDALCTLDGQFRGRLHIGAVAPADYFLPGLLAAFRRRHPELRLRLSIDHRDALLTQLADRKLDLVLSGYPPAEAEVEAEAFARHPHCVIAPPDHPLAGQPTLAWEALRHDTFVFRESGSTTRSFLERLLQVHRLQVPVDIELQGNEAVKQAVMAGMGISFVSAHIVQTELKAGRLVVLNVEGTPKCLDWCVLTRRDTPLSAGQRALRSFVMEEGQALTACVAR